MRRRWPSTRLGAEVLAWVSGGFTALLFLAILTGLSLSVRPQTPAEQQPTRTLKPPSAVAVSKIEVVDGREKPEKRPQPISRKSP